MYVCKHELEDINCSNIRYLYLKPRPAERGAGGANVQGPGDLEARQGPAGPGRARQGPQSTLSTYEKIYIGPVTALYERARDRSAQGPGFSLGGPAQTIFKRIHGRTDRQPMNIMLGLQMIIICQL